MRGILLPGLDEARFDSAKICEFFLDQGPGFVGLLLALANRLAGAAIQHNSNNIFQRLAILAHQRGIGQGGEDENEAEGAQACAPSPRIKAKANDDKRAKRQRDQQRDRDLGSDLEVEGGQWASRSRRSRTCT